MLLGVFYENTAAGIQNWTGIGQCVAAARTINTNKGYSISYSDVLRYVSATEPK